MLFILRFTDKPGSLALREQHLKAHLAWLDAHASEVLVAGTIRPEPEAAAVAAIWIVTAPSRQAVLALSDSEPFWINGLRATREVFYYRAHSALPAFNAG
jgi:hypothetical protein